MTPLDASIFDNKIYQIGDLIIIENKGILNNDDSITYGVDLPRNRDSRAAAAAAEAAAPSSAEDGFTSYKLHNWRCVLFTCFCVYL